MWRKIVATAKGAQRIRGGGNTEELRSAVMRLREWRQEDIPSFQRRVYRSYRDYLRHQAAKLETWRDSQWLAEYDARFSAALRERLLSVGLVGRGTTVLCLGARIGSEVRAFLAIGCFCLGIDLNPGQGNRYVVYGDFHEIQYPAECVDVVFTNSLDHVFDVERVIAEIWRVLRREGIFIAECVSGMEEGGRAGSYESFFWSRIDDVVTFVESHGFLTVHRSGVEYPWKGEHLCFRKLV